MTSGPSSPTVCYGALDPPVGGTFHFENLVMPPLTKACPKMVLSHKGGSLCVKDVFAKKFFGAERDSAGGALGSVRHNLQYNGSLCSAFNRRAASSRRGAHRMDGHRPRNEYKGPGATWSLSALEFTGECSRTGAWRVNHADVCSNPARGGLNLAGALRDTLLFIVDPTNWPRSVRGLLLSGASSDFVILWTEQCASTAGT